jgi:predicted transcriptional regulator
MRTTLTIDDDVLDRARSVAERLRTPFRQIVNEAIRAGLKTVAEPATTKTYQTRPHKLGLKAGRSLDNIQELLGQIEGEEHR